MTSQILIETPRLLLKSITPVLIHSLFKEKSKEAIMRYFNIEEAGYAHLKEMHERGMETHRISLFYFLLFDKETQECIGECGFHTWNKTHHKADLFYSLRADTYKQKGFMTEALKEVIAFGFTELQLHRQAALVASWNIASVKLLEHFKFTQEGILREDYIVNDIYEDSVSYSLLKQEWVRSSI